MSQQRHRAIAPTPTRSGGLFLARSWRARASAIVLAVVVTIVGLVAPTLTDTRGAAAAVLPQTVVSFTFDDGSAGQMQAASAMNAKNMDGTFYVNSGFIGASGYLTRANLDSLKAAGHEIGGHTVNHPDLATIPAQEVSRQICNDRATLTSWGFTVRSFAYPFASTNATAEQAAESCGYNSARMLGDVRSRFGCSGCSYSETIPPADPFYTRALDQVESTWTLADLKNGVLNAEKNGGGWVQYTFHTFCASGCANPTMTPALFTSFVNWLAPRAAAQNTIVKTVGDVVGGAAGPVVNGPSNPPVAPGTNGAVNPSLESFTGNLPTCYVTAGFGTNTPSHQLVSPGRTGAKASRITMTGYSSGDSKLIPALDSGTCSPTVVAGHPYELGSWYTSTTVTQFSVYLRSTSGTWQYWTSSPWFGAASSYTQALWTTPAIPAGFDGISFGLNIFGNGVLTTDDYSIYDKFNVPTPVITGVVNPSLETAGVGGVPSCWSRAGFGTNTPAYSLVTGRTGTVASKITMTGYTSGDAKLLPAFDNAACAPNVTPGQTYQLGAWYTSTTATQYAVYLRTSAGVWQYWTSSPWFGASSTYTQANWTTPAIPAGFTAISFGLSIFSNGELVTDDYSIGGSVAARSAVPAPASPPAVQGPVEVLVTDPAATP
ncbi:polysaccharide deacetylase family protein [Marisediminicola senii]|uniref:polysaccharide deacetylase family protein n=1 Tax=Marisediminicola senii TaxID=2711233 RepID=UPI0013EA1E84|nr:polysaccharide deacetylase family protein [Marisediminicola senii]